MAADDEATVRRVWRRLGGDDATIDAVLARYREPHRRYHTVVHLARVVRDVDELLHTETMVGDRDAVRAAAVFHDVVYDPRASDNEARSADLAIDRLTGLGWSAERTAHVRDLVMATAGHETSAGSGPISDPTAVAVLLDADLAVLGASPAVYQAYVRGVRDEYRHVDDDGWRQGRAAVLRTFLDRPRIYGTPTMYDRAERRARANLAAELASLTNAQ